MTPNDVNEAAHAMNVGTPINELTHYLKNVSCFLKQLPQSLSSGALLFSSYEDLVLRMGREFVPAKLNGPRRPMKQCYANALHVALERDLDYIEGYAYSQGSIPVLHAWCAEQGRREALDPTWKFHPKTLYHGIRFSARDAATAMTRVGIYGLIPSGYLMDHVLLRTGSLESFIKERA